MVGPVGISRLRRSVIAVLVAALAALGTAVAQADEATLEQRAAATRAFEEGERAFAAGSFARAAEAFEAAYAAARHPAPVWNAARSWHRAGSLDRAATLYALYLREAPPDAADRDAALAALEELAPKLGRLDVFAPEAMDVRIDERPLREVSVYVYPGAHVLEGRVHGEALRRTEVLVAGEVRSVALIEVKPRVDDGGSARTSRALPPNPRVDDGGSARTSRALPPNPRGPTPPAPTKPPVLPPVREQAPPSWLPVVSLAAGGVSLVTAGATIWSGMDTLAALHDFQAAPTQDKLDAGRGKQLRTNVLLGASLGAAALCGVALTAWGIEGRGGSVRVAATPSGLFVAGSF
jgi:hypothetical protein